jgi:hypothetical protein
MESVDIHLRVAPTEAIDIKKNCIWLMGYAVEKLVEAMR